MADVANGGERLDTALGKLALDKGLITIDQLADALNRRTWGGAIDLGDALIRAGYLTGAQWNALREEHESGSRPSLATIPERLGKFLLHRELGRGTAGVVHQATDTATGREVALKILLMEGNPAETRQERERFLREARLTAGLSPHRNLVPVYEAGEVEGRLYLSMELVKGKPLPEWKKSGSITTRHMVTLLRDVALAVHHAHEQGVIHRDLKPENILVDAKNEPHITDFGLAKRIKGARETTLTTAGMLMGTPGYMSPEQIRGRKNLDRRTDVFSLGVMLYEALTGRRPFEGPSAFDIMMKSLHDPVPPPSKHTRLLMNPLIFKSLELVCLKALAKEPSQRYATGLELAQDLTRWLQGEQFMVKIPPSRRLKLAALGGAAGLALLLAGVLYLTLRDPHAGEVGRGRAFLARERFHEAVESFDKVLAASPSHPRALAGKQETLRKIDALVGTTTEVVLDAARNVRMKFAFVRPGTFVMGDPRNDGEKRAHPVTLTRCYWIQTTEVTQAQWETVMGSNPSQHKGPDRPVDSVKWSDAVAFAEGLTARLGGARKASLPTEAEWEYACRAGKLARWGFGDDPSLLAEHGWFRENAGSATHPVARKKPNAWGLYDMHGNVLEWCQDWLAAYPDQATDPRGPSYGIRKVLRGGYYDDPPSLTDSAVRNWGIPEVVHPGCGLRLVLH